MKGLVKARDSVRFEDFQLDLRIGELRRDTGKTVRLPEQPFRILTMLLERPGDVVTREDIRKRVWKSWNVKWDACAYSPVLIDWAGYSAWHKTLFRRKAVSTEDRPMDY
jgi:hypothetical protein